METIIRPAKNTDLEIIDDFQNGIGILERSLDSNIKKSGRIRYYTLEEIKELITSENAIINIAEINGKPIGCGFGKIQKNHADWSKLEYKWYIGMMFVQEQYRNQWMWGIILKSILDWFKKRWIEDIRLQVYRNNDIAINSYKKTRISRIYCRNDF